MRVLGKFAWIIIIILVLIAISQYSPDFTKLGEKRLELSRQNDGNIEIAIMQTPGETSGYLNGVMLAVEEINQRPDKLLGRSLKIHLEQEGETFEDTKSTIRKVVANPKITAVLGHRRSSIAIPASVIYERSQVIFITPFATAKSLTGHGFKYVFRMVPDNSVMADQLASVAQTLGYKNIVTLYSRDELSREVAFLFEDIAIKQGISITKSTSFSEKDTNYRPIISQFNSEPFDAVFIASSADAAALMASQLREMGIHKPILGSDSLNKELYTEKASNSARNTIIPSIYHPDQENPISKHFTQTYKKRYEEEPDHNAAQGYDSVMLLATAIERAGSTLPPLLSTTLHYMPAWIGVTGIHAFDEDGELQGKKYFFKVWQKQAWQDLPAIHVPYLLKRFTQSQQAETNYPQVFSRRMHDDEHKIHLLDVAQQILGFKRIGLIYEDTEIGRMTASYELLQSLARKKGIDIAECVVPFSQKSRSELKQAMLACYGKLSLSSDALFLPSYRGIDEGLLEKLNSSLTFFKIPAISLDEKNTDPNVSLVLTKRSDVNTQNLQSMQVYSEILNGMKVHEFSAFLKNLPEVTINLTSLQYQGFSDHPILELSPDNYIHSHPLVIKKNMPQ